MKEFIGKIFNKEKCNFDRQYEIDLLRGFTTILLIICHVGYYLSNNETSWMFYFCDLIGSEPAAPVFMILMGISVVFSKHQDAKHYLKRGLILFIGSYILNFVRCFPYFFLGEIDYFACVQGFFTVDIYQLAGLSFLLFALFKKMKMPSWGVFIVSIILLIIGHILIATNCLDFPVKATYILNLFLPTDSEWCCFNLFTWFIYPSFGLILGELIIRCKNKNLFYLILLILGSIGVIALYVNIGVRFPDYTSYYLGNNYYRMGILNTIVTLLYACFALAIWYFIGKKLPSFLSNTLTFLSKNLPFIYVSSWVEISILYHIVVYYNIDFSVLALWGLSIGILLNCSLLSILYRKIKTNIKQHKIRALDANA